MRIWFIMTLSVLAAVALVWLLLRGLPEDLEWVRVASYAAVIVLGGVSASLVKRRFMRKRSVEQGN